MIAIGGMRAQRDDERDIVARGVEISHCPTATRMSFGSTPAINSKSRS
jgi:cytosine/adenosine deaminase-related metal-dependent hydrolase